MNGISKCPQNLSAKTNIVTTYSFQHTLQICQQTFMDYTDTRTVSTHNT